MRVLRNICLSVSLCLAAYGPGAAMAAGAMAATTDGTAAEAGTEATPRLALYLTIKEPLSTYVLGSSRRIGRLRRDELEKLARDRRLIVLLPQMTSIIDEAMMAARIAAGDLSGLGRGAAALGTPNLLTGRLVNVGPQKWSVTWLFSNAVGRHRQAIANAPFNDAIKSGLAMAADVLSGKVALERHPAARLYRPTTDDVEARQDKMGEQLPN